MAKAFEYRMLRPYNGDLNLDRLFQQFLTLVEKPGADHLLSQADFESLENVYLEELRRIAAEIFEELNANAPERSVPVRFGLTPDELRRLNERGVVVINLAERPLFGRTEENLRIVDLKTRNLEVRTEGGDFRSTAILRLKFEHSGDSRIRSRGETYRFTHHRTASVNPITWKTVYDAVERKWVETAPSVASESLLRSLLPEARDLLLYSRPAAWADTIITKEVTTDNPEVDLVIEELRLELTYDFSDKRSDLADLDVEVSGDLMPAIRVDHEDVNRRRDGRGDFLRVYNLLDRVRLEAPPTYGLWKFQRWTDGVGNDLRDGGGAQEDGTRSEVSVRMDRHRTLRAVYEFAGEDEKVPYIRGDPNTDGSVDISDAVRILGFLFRGEGDLPCESAADSNDDGEVDISDAVLILIYRFLGGATIPDPGPSLCGLDPTPDGLTCELVEICR